MARFAAEFAILVVLAPQILATPCVEGSCPADSTSLLQVQDIVKTAGRKRDSPYEKLGSDPHHETLAEAVRLVKHSPDDEDGNDDMNELITEQTSKLNDSPKHGRRSEGTAKNEREHQHSKGRTKNEREHQHSKGTAKNEREHQHSKGTAKNERDHQHSEGTANNDKWVHVVHLRLPATEPGDDKMMPVGSAVIEAYDGSMDNAGAEIEDQVVRDAGRYETARAIHHDMVSRVRDLQDHTIASLEDDEASVEDALENRRALEARAISEVEEARKMAEEAEMEKEGVQDAAVAGHAAGVMRDVEVARMDIHDLVHDAVLNDGQEGVRAARERALAERILAGDEALDLQSAEATAYVTQTAEQMEAVREDGKTTARLWRNDIEGADGLKNHMIREDAEHEADDYGHLIMRDGESIDNTVREGAGYVMADRLADAVSR